MQWFPPWRGLSLVQSIKIINAFLSVFIAVLGTIDPTKRRFDPRWPPDDPNWGPKLKIVNVLTHSFAFRLEVFFVLHYEFFYRG